MSKKLRTNPMITRTLSDLEEVIKDALALPKDADARESRKQLKKKTLELIARVQDLGDAEMNKQIEEIFKNSK